MHAPLSRCAWRPHSAQVFEYYALERQSQFIVGRDGLACDTLLNGCGAVLNFQLLRFTERASKERVGAALVGDATIENLLQ